MCLVFSVFNLNFCIADKNNFMNKFRFHKSAIKIDVSNIVRACVSAFFFVDWLHYGSSVTVESNKGQENSYLAHASLLFHS